VLVDDFERLHPELLDHPLGHHFADALDESRAEVALDADQRHGDDRLEDVDLELLAEPLVVDPAALQLHAFARADANQITDGGHRLAAIRHGNLDDAPRALFVGEGDPFEHALERRLLSVVRRPTRWAAAGTAGPPQALLRCHGPSLPRAV